MSYFIFYGAFATWVLLDGLNRKLAAQAVLWAFGTALFGPIALPVFLACRPLKQGEVSEGGKPWNIFKNFAILWTIVMAIATALALISVANKSTVGLTNDFERVGEGIGTVVGMSLLAAIWFFPTVGAALLAFLLKKNSVIENGPTGPLVGSASAATPFGGWVGMATAAFLGIIAVGGWNVLAEFRAKARAADKAPAQVPAQAPASDDNNWVLAESMDEMDNTPVVILSNSGSDRSTLVIRCSKRKTEVYITAGTMVATDAVRIKFDQGSPIRQSWSRSTDYEGLFAPDAIALSRQLAGANAFLFEFTPENAGARLVRFDVSNLAPKLRRVSDACDWAAVDTSRAKARAADIVPQPTDAERRADLEKYVHKCWMHPDKWCYTRPGEGSIELGPEATHDDALDDLLYDTSQSSER